jgi:benzoyl-CoA reductase/2-hydroxyglutaryl-CoA dehydratase subunit BcrC/BadD/HgdB
MERADRAGYIERQREAHGRRSIAVLPVHYPKALLTAHDVLAVELWGPPGAPRSNEAGRLQTYVCAVVRNALAFLAAGQADCADALLVPHTCDSLQGLATLTSDFGGWKKPRLVFQHPRGGERASARRFVEAELRALSLELERLCDRSLDAGRLTWALELHARIDGCRARLLGQRRRVALTDRELYALLRRGEGLWPEEHLAELEAAIAASLREQPAQEGIPVLVTGYVPEPAGFLEALNEAGAYIAADDYAAVGRRIVPRRAAGVDPWNELVENHFFAVPCPTRGADWSERMRYLAELASRASVKGVVIHVQKFCEPELFDVPAIRKTFERVGLPLLYLEGELESELSGQARTRLEAFVEILGSRGSKVVAA